MSLQYLRQLSLVVADNSGAGLDFGTFWCTFTVKRGDKQTPNSLDARIYNLKNATAQKIQKKEFTQVSLSAGYNPTRDSSFKPPLIFQGTIKQFRAGRVNQLDSYVDITAADGDEAYNFAPIFTTVQGGSSNQPSQIADQIRGAFAKFSDSQPITNGYQPDYPPNTLTRGKVLYGMARDEAREFAWQNNSKWSIDNGAFTVIPYTSYVPGGPVPLISVATGLIGVPEQTQQGISIRTLLNANYKIGQLIKLDSQINQFRLDVGLLSQANNPQIEAQAILNQQGLYYVMCANHTGDTREQNWYTDLTCLAVDASLASTDATQALFVPPGAASAIIRYGGT
jgi:hypothetical protein